MRAWVPDRDAAGPVVSLYHSPQALARIAPPAPWWRRAAWVLRGGPRRLRRAEERRREEQLFREACAALSIDPRTMGRMVGAPETIASELAAVRMPWREPDPAAPPARLKAKAPVSPPPPSRWSE